MIRTRTGRAIADYSLIVTIDPRRLVSPEKNRGHAFAAVLAGRDRR